ncbi:MAG: hypothetical protein MZV70_28310 [Desulfobacterales bacterium]|nr:hypothetical protein [Desulfobacterales bacterium]
MPGERLPGRLFVDGTQGLLIHSRNRTRQGIDGPSFHVRHHQNDHDVSRKTVLFKGFSGTDQEAGQARLADGIELFRRALMKAFVRQVGPAGEKTFGMDRERELGFVGVNAAKRHH